MEDELYSDFVRMTFDMPKNIHTELKIWCITRNATMKQYILQAIIEKIAQDKRYSEDPNATRHAGRNERR